MVVLLPVIDRVRRPFGLVPIVAIVAMQAALVVVSSRVAGLESSAGEALMISAAAWAAAAFVLRFGVSRLR